MWRQIPWVANGLTVQGGLELLTGFVLLSGAADSDTGPPTGFYDVFLYQVAPWCLLATGALKALAARRNRRFRGRGFGLLALWSGVASGLVWMCAPSGLVLLIFGSIVYRDRTSREAFALGESGELPEQVTGHLKRSEPM